jgi:cell division transport system permease protein
VSALPYSLREALAAFQRSPLLTGLSITMIGLSLLVVGLFAVAAFNIRRVLDQVEARVEVVAYLRDDADFDAVMAAMAELKKMPTIRDVQYISREQALEIAKREVPEFQDIFRGLETNPLPASLEISLKPQQRGPQAVHAVAQRANQYPFVEDVLFGREWLDKVYLLRRVAGAATLILGGAFAVVAALIIGAAIRIAVFARRDEILIMRLVGATDGFVRRPFLIEGLMTGLGGGVFALVLTFVAYKVLSQELFKLVWIPDLWVVGILTLGAALGSLASAAAVRRHLRQI